MDVDAVVAEQVDYYKARAPQYDDWWERRHEYDEGPEFAAAWRNDVEELHGWLRGQGPLGAVLELAAGTGNWTLALTRQAMSVTAVDASKEVLALNAVKVDDEQVEYVIADLFGWKPARTYDTVFFGFWISHVPAERWDEFWDLVADAVEPGGRVLFVDNARPERAAANGPQRESPPTPSGRDPVAAQDQVTRTLRDGSTYTIIKRYWSPPQLEADLRSRGWACTVGETSFAFIYGEARRA